MKATITFPGKKAAFTVVLLFLSTAAWCFSDFTNLFYPPWGKFPFVMVPDSVYRNLDSVTVNIEIDELSRDYTGTSIYTNTVSLKDTNYFQYLGNVVPDSADSVGSVLYGYRFIYTGYSTSPGSVASYDLLLQYRGEDYNDFGSLANDCMPFNSCPGTAFMNNIYSAIVGQLPYTPYTYSYDAMPAYNQQVVATMLNWAINNSNPGVSDYLSLLVTDHVSSFIPPAFCSEQSSGNCYCQHQLIDSLSLIQSQLAAIGPDSFSRFEDIVELGAETFVFNCFCNGSYILNMESVEDSYSGYLISGTPYKAGMPEMVGLVVFDGDSIYKAMAFSYDWTYSGSGGIGINYSGGGVFTYSGGFQPISADTSLSTFPLAGITPSDTLVEAGQPVVFTAYGANQFTWPYLGESTSSVLVHPLTDTVFYSVQLSDTSGCSQNLTGMARTNGPLNQSVNVSISLFDAAHTETCKLNTFSVDISFNSDTNVAFGIRIKFPHAIDTMTYGMNNGGLFTHWFVNDSTLIIGSSHPLPADTGINLKYWFYFPCSVIPRVVNPSFLDSITVVNATGGPYLGTFSINGDTTSHTVLESFHYSFPFLDYVTGYNAPVTTHLSRGQSQMIETQYANGAAPYKGNIIITSGFNCSNEVIIDSVKIFMKGHLRTTLRPDSSAWQLTIAADSLTGDGSSLIIDQYFHAAGCIPDPSGCTDALTVQWGCPSNLCRTIGPRYINVYKSTDEPQLVVERITPRALPTGGLENAWDGSCANDETQWEFLIANIDTGHAIAHNVKVDLSGIAALHTLIRKSSIQVITSDSRFPNDTAVTIRPAKYFMLHPGDTTPTCVGSLTAAFDTVVREFILDSFDLHPGRNIILRFNTYRCCASDNAWNSGVLYNHWKLNVHGFDDCNAVIVANSGVSDAQLHGWPYHNTGDTTTYHTLYANPDISSNAYDDGPDLELDQHYRPQTIDITGSKNDCGAPVPFTITNLSFTGDHPQVSDFDTQLFCDSAVNTASGAGVTGINPQGQFKVTIVAEHGIHVYADTPTIAGWNVIWHANTAWQQSDTIWTAIFDISHLGYTTSQEFRNFFINSLFNFKLQGCCTDPHYANPKVHVYTSFNAMPTSGCDTCWIPLSKIDFQLQLHCPGCVTPGMIVDDFNLIRTDSSLGFVDANNDRLPEENGNLQLQPINSSYTPYQDNLLNLKASISGDKLSATVESHFQAGDDADGFTYGTWQEYWAAHNWSGTLGDTPAFTHFYLEQTIAKADSAGLTLTGATLEYYPLGGTAHHDYIFTALPTTQHLDSGKVRILFHATTTQIGGGARFEETDKFILREQFTVCKNPQSLTTLITENQMYLTVYDADSISPFNSDTVAPLGYHASDSIYGLSHMGANEGPQAYSPNNKWLFICEGFAGAHDVYSIDTVYQEFIDNSNSCSKLATLRAHYFINGGATENVFPYEYRLLPGMHATHIANGPTLISGKPITFHFTVPQDYSATLLRSFSKARSYYTNIYQPNIVSDIEVRSDTNLIHGGGRAITGYDGRDYYLDSTFAQYTPPFTHASPFGAALHNFYTAPPSDPEVTQYLTIGADTLPVLVIGDESFDQSLEFSLTPLCAQIESDTTVVADTSNYVIIPGYSNGCSQPDSDVVLDNGQEYEFSVPKPVISATVQTPVFGQGYFDCELDMTVTPDSVNKILLFFEVPNSLDAHGVSFACMATGTGCTGPFTGDTVHDELGTTYNRFIIRDSVAGPHAYHFRFNITNCDLAGESFNLPINYAWTCQDNFVPQDTVPPLPNLCDTVRLANFNITMPAIVLTQTQSGGGGNVSTCSAITLHCNIKSSAAGGIGNFIDSLYLPQNAVLLRNNIQIMLAPNGINTFHSIPASRATATAVGVDTLWRIDLNGFTSFVDTALFGIDGLNNTDGQMQLLIQIFPNCHATELDNIHNVINFEEYCGLQSSMTYNFDTTFVYVNGSGNCGLNVSAVPVTNICRQIDWSYNTNPNGGIDQSSPPVHVVWSFDAGNDNRYTNASRNDDFTANDTLAGVYTVTITDTNFCVFIDTFIIDSVLQVAVHSTDTCFQSNNGYINLTVTGGRHPYSYLWNTGDSTASLTGLYSGMYIVTVHDSVACQVHDTIQLNNFLCCFARHDTVPPIVIDQDTLSSQLSIPTFSRMYVAPYVTLTVDNVFMLSLCEVVMGAGSEIIVESGDSLILDGSRFHGCDSMWNGIYLSPGSGARMYPDNDYYPTIEDALTGLSVSGEAVADLEQVQFIQNWIGAYFANCHDGEGFYKVENCNFGLLTGSHPSILPLKAQTPYIHLILQNAIYPKIGIVALQCDLTIPQNETAYPNNFSNLSTGIWGTGSNLNIFKNSFQNIHDYDHNGSPIMGAAIYANNIQTTQHLQVETSPDSASAISQVKFFKCDYGIKCRGMSLAAYNNKMDSVGNGIYTSDCRNYVSIYQNYITHTNAGITLNSNTVNQQNVWANTIFVNDPVGSVVVPLRAFGSSHVFLNTYGISQTEGGLQGTANIFWNYIYNGRNCIALNNTGASQVFLNTLYQKSNTTVTGVQSGIYASNCSNPLFTGNFVYGNSNLFTGATRLGTTSPSPTRKIGINLYATQNGELCRNVLGGIDSSNGLGYGLNFSADCHWVNVRGNQLKQSKYGIVLNSSGVTHVLSNQGSPITSHANLFIGDSTASYVFANSTHYRTFSFIYAPNSYVRPNFYSVSPDAQSNPQYTFPDGANLPQKEVRPQPSSDSISNECESVSWPEYIPLRSFRDTATQLIAADQANELTEAGFEATAPWLDEHKLYRLLCDSAEIGSRLNTLPAGMDTMLTNYIDTVSSDLMASIAADLLDELNTGKPTHTWADTSALEDSVIADFFYGHSTSDYNDIQVYTNQLQVLFDSTSLSDTTTFNSALATAISLNSSISGSHVQAENFKTVQSIYLDIIAYGDSIVDTTMLHTLDSIAVQCPYIAGDAVYYARALYHRYDNSPFYDDLVLCTPEDSTGYERMLQITNTQTDTVKTVSKNEFVKVFPNPANQLLNLAYNANTVGLVQFELLDNLSRAVLVQELGSGQQLAQFTIDKLGSGLYYWRLKDSERIIRSGKIIILR